MLAGRRRSGRIGGVRSGERSGNRLPGWKPGDRVVRVHAAAAGVLPSVMPDPIFQFFAYDHLPRHLQAVSRPFGELAAIMADLPDNAERAVALRKLLESKDAAVRALLAK